MTELLKYLTVLGELILFEVKKSKKLLSLLLATSIGAAGVAGFELGRSTKPAKPKPTVLTEHVIDEQVDYRFGVDLLVSGRYGTSEHSVPFLSHFDESCEQQPNGSAHSETILGDEYSLEAFINQARDVGQLCIVGNAQSMEGIKDDTDIVLGLINYQFNPNPDPNYPGSYNGGASRTRLSDTNITKYKSSILLDGVTHIGFGLARQPESQWNTIISRFTPQQDR